VIGPQEQMELPAGQSQVMVARISVK